MAISFALLWTVKFNRWASLCLSGTRLKIQMGPLLKSKGTTRSEGRWKGASTQFSLNGRNNSWISKLDCLTRVQELVWRLTPQVSPPSRSSDTSGLSLNPELGPFLCLTVDRNISKRATLRRYRIF